MFCHQEGHPACKTLHQKSLHKLSTGQLANRGLAGKMPGKMVYVFLVPVHPDCPLKCCNMVVVGVVQEGDRVRETAEVGAKQ